MATHGVYTDASRKQAAEYRLLLSMR